MFRIVAGTASWYVTRQPIQSVLEPARRLSTGYPVGQDFLIFRGSVLVAQSALNYGPIDALVSAYEKLFLSLIVTRSG
jgi:hypothetical protein